MRRLFLFLILFGLALPSLAQQLLLPLKPKSVRFAVIGDTGTGGKAQYQVGVRIVEYREKFPFDFIIMVGDNIYGSAKPSDYQKKFELPYKRLLDAGVKFHAALGNHDNTNERVYESFNMHGDRYYTFKKENVRFFALDSNYMDPRQLEWLEKELRNSGADWKICFFHHPLYSSGGHGSAKELRRVLEPVLMKYGVNVVFAGHEHFYERIKPQHGIYYFTSGGAANISRRNIRKTDLTAKGFDQDNSFMLVEIAGDDLYFQTISRTGQTVDSGVIRRPTAKPESKPD
jgi:3',5'-cyclic AMP phosphodiesterase CpdA